MALNMQDSRDVPTSPIGRRNAIVLTADLLGFGNRVRATSDDSGACLLLDRLDRFARQFSEVEYEDKQTHEFFAKRYWAFSDGIVICWYDGSDAQAAMTDFDADMDQLSGIALAQSIMMLNDGQLVRGGIGLGWFVEREGTVAGTALVNAAAAEKKIGLPFIGVQPALYDRCRDHHGRRFYAHDADPFPDLFIPPCEYTRDCPALDYFMAGLQAIDLTDRQRQQTRSIGSDKRQAFMDNCVAQNRLSFVEKHRSFVTKGLQHTDRSIQNKYDALRQHHNARVTALYTDPAGLLVA